MKFRIDRFKGSTVIKNFATLSIGEVLGRGLNMFTNIILARWLAPEKYGVYSLVLTYIMVFYTISSLGLRQSIIRSIARNQNNSSIYLNYSILWRIIGFALGISIFYVYDWIYPFNLPKSIVYILLASVLAMSFSDALQNVSFGMQKVKYTSLIDVLLSFLVLITYFFFPKNYISVQNVLIVYLIFNILKVILYYWSLKKKHLITNSLDEKKALSFWSILKESLPFYVLVVFSLFTTQFPIIFLNLASNYNEIAYFNTANKLLLPITLFMNTALSALFPNMAKLYNENVQAFVKQTKKIMILFIFFGVFTGISISLFRGELVRILYGENYISSSEVIAYQCWFLVILTFYSYIGNIFGATDNQKVLMYTSIIYAVISLPILFFSAKYGAVGLSKGYIVVSVLNFGYTAYYLAKALQNQITIWFVLKLFIVILGAVIFSISLSPEVSINIRIVVFLVVLAAIFYKRNYLLQLVVK